MRKLRIGVSAAFEYANPERPVFGIKTLCYVERDLARYMSRSNAVPILIPDLEDEAIEAFMAELDGVVLQGGTDLAPATYGEEPIVAGRWLGDATRDQYELKVLQYALAQNKPLLGICRGFQLMNAYFGGTLYQDIETQLPGARNHRDAETYDKFVHAIRWKEGSLFDQWHSNEQSRLVNSIHHQGVKELGRDLEPIVWSKEDGIIEAFYWTKAPVGKVMAVQWHPEFSYNAGVELIDETKLYDHFLTFCERP